MASLVPALLDAIVSSADAALPTVGVYDVDGPSDSGSDFLIVGVEDPDEVGFSESAEVAHDWAGFASGVREQMGTLWCVLESWNGDSDPKAARDAVDGYFGTIKGLLRSDATILAAVSYATVATERWSQSKTADGAVVRLAFQVGFKAIA